MKRFKILTRTAGFDLVLRNQERPELLDVEESISGQFKVSSKAIIRIEIELPNKKIEKMELQANDDYEVLCRPIFKIYKKGILKIQTLEENK